ncbi:hypothetical protein H6G82_29385 [Planktothricoides sp. FACHB-1261]|nr:hypothetical protein [Planktothricoides raciborskii FACHB-1261]
MLCPYKNQNLGRCRGKAFGQQFLEKNAKFNIRMLCPNPQGKAFGRNVNCDNQELITESFAPTTPTG